VKKDTQKRQTKRKVFGARVDVGGLDVKILEWLKVERNK